MRNEYLTEQRERDDYQKPHQGDLHDRYNIYLTCANDGNGRDITTGNWLKTFDEWLES